MARKSKFEKQVKSIGLCDLILGGEGTSGGHLLRYSWKCSVNHWETKKCSKSQWKAGLWFFMDRRQKRNQQPEELRMTQWMASPQLAITYIVEYKKEKHKKQGNEYRPETAMWEYHSKLLTPENLSDLHTHAASCPIHTIINEMWLKINNTT